MLDNKAFMASVFSGLSQNYYTCFNCPPLIFTEGWHSKRFEIKSIHMFRC